MTEASRTILECFQVRKSKGQKAEFRAWLCDTLTKAGYTPQVETALAMPEEDRDKVCFVFFDNEEKGLFGSSAFAKAHPQVKREKLLINFDCVSDGDYIQFFPTKALKKDDDTLRRLRAAFQGRGGKTCEVVTGFGFYPSDQAQYRRGVGVCALKKSKLFGYCMDRIHTNRDTVLMAENIGLLRDGALALAADCRRNKTA